VQANRLQTRLEVEKVRRPMAKWLQQGMQPFRTIQELIDSGRLTEAIALLRKAADGGQDSAAVLNTLGLALAQARRFEEAVEVYKKLVAVAPPPLQALDNLGFILTSLGRYGEALPYLRQSVAREPDSIRTLGQPGHRSEGVDPGPRKLWACLREDRCARSAQPESICNLALRLRNSAAMKKPSSSLKRRWRQTHFGAALTMRSVLARLDRHEEAIGHYRKRLRSDPGNAAAHNDLGRSLTELGPPTAKSGRGTRTRASSPARVRARQTESGDRDEESRPLAFDFGKAAGGGRGIPTRAVRPAGFARLIWGSGDALNYLGRPQEALAVFEKSSPPIPTRRWPIWVWQRKECPSAIP